MERVAGGREPHRPGLEGLSEHPGHLVELVVRSLRLERSLAHDPGAQCRVAEVGGVVDPLGEPVDRVEVLREGLPAPPDPLGHSDRGDVLGPFQVPDHQLAPVGPGRGQREPAVAHHHRRHALPTGRRAQLVPEDLGIHVGVPVHEAGADDVPFGIDLLAPAAR